MTEKEMADAWIRNWWNDMYLRISWCLKYTCEICHRTPGNCQLQKGPCPNKARKSRSYKEI